MSEDPRCCGSGTCIINAEGRCWCGRQWDDETMHQAPPALLTPAAIPDAESTTLRDPPLPREHCGRCPR